MENNQQISLLSFADEVIKDADFEDLGEDFKQGLTQKIMQEAIQRLGLLVAAELSEDKLKEYGELAAKSKNPANDPEISKFITDNIPDFAQKSQNVLSSYKNEFVDEVKKAMK